MILLTIFWTCQGFDFCNREKNKKEVKVEAEQYVKDNQMQALHCQTLTSACSTFTVDGNTMFPQPKFELESMTAPGTRIMVCFF